MADRTSKIYSKQLAKTLKVLPQTGKIIDFIRDKGRPAKFPGKRMSSEGKIYWETRKNRTDAPFKEV